MIGDRIEVSIAGGLDVELPKMVRVRQKFKTPTLEDVAGAVRSQFDNPDIRKRIKPGMRIADGRFSGVSRGFCIGYVTPEAALGGLLSLVENGDRICIDLNAKSLHLDVDEAVLAERRDGYEASDRSGKGHMVEAGYAQKYIASVGPASHGAVTHSGNLHWPQEGE